MFHCTAYTTETYNASTGAFEANRYWLLSSDPRVDCNDADAQTWMLYLGVPMLVIFVVGIPVVLWIVLYANVGRKVMKGWRQERKEQAMARAAAKKAGKPRPTFPAKDNQFYMKHLPQGSKVKLGFLFATCALRASACVCLEGGGGAHRTH